MTSLQQPIYPVNPPDPPPKSPSKVVVPILGQNTSSNVRRLPPKSTINEVNGSTTKPAAIIKPRLTYEEFLPLVRSEFTKLHSKTLLNSAFEWIEYSYQLFEQLKIATDPDIALRSYIRGYIVFHYFVNQFIMDYFNGFGLFMKTSRKDFMVYLNLYEFYRSDEILSADAFNVDLVLLRKWIIDFLVAEKGVSLDLESLFDWLDKYVDYFKNNKNPEDTEFEDDLIQDEDFDDVESLEFHTAYPPSTTRTNTGGLDQTSLLAGNEEEFIQAFPEMPDHLSGPKSLKSKQQPEKAAQSSKTAGPKDVIETPYPVSFHAFDDEPSFEKSSTKPPPSRSAGASNNNMRGPPRASTVGYFPRESQIPNHLGSFTALTDSVFSSPNVQTAYLVNQPSAQNNEYKHNNNFNQNYPPTSIQSYERSLPPLSGFNSTLSPEVVVSPLGRGRPPPPQNYNMNRPHTISNGQFHGGNQVQYNGWLDQPQIHPQSMMNSNFIQQAPQNPQFQYSANPFNQQQQAQQHHIHRRNQLARNLGISGLVNHGSTCYINLIVQVLGGIFDFYRVLSLCTKRLQVGPLTHALMTLLYSFQKSGGSNINPSLFLRTVSKLKPDFHIPREQQDAQEFLLFILQTLHEENSSKPEHDVQDYLKTWQIDVNPQDKEEYLKWYKTLVEAEKRSPINDMFQGHVQNKLKCNKCGFLSISYSPFTILSLPIPLTGSGNVDLSYCILCYSQDEVLCGENAWRCPKCNKTEGDGKENPMDVVFQPKRGLFRLPKRGKSPPKKMDSTKLNAPPAISIKLLTFIKLPPILFIHLSRFFMDSQTDKLSTQIKFPARLSFSREGHDIWYVLVGLVNHYGSLKSGHYTAEVNRAFSDPQNYPDPVDQLFWCTFDDQNIRMREHIGEGRNKNPKQTSESVYVLCYQRVK